MRVTAISVVIGALGSVPQKLEKRQVELEIGANIETIQTTALLKLAIILGIVLET